MYKYSNGLLPDVFDTLFCKLADVHEYNTRNVHQCNIFMSAFDQQIEVKKLKFLWR